MHRAPTERLRRLAASFSGWGIPTAESLRTVYDVRAEMGLVDLPIFASGGIRSGQDVAKCTALGAELVGLASPFLKPAVDSVEAVIDEMEIIETELRIAMFCSEAGNVAALRQPGLLTHSTHEEYSRRLPTHGGERS